MRTTPFDLRHLADDALLEDLRSILSRTHIAEAELLVHLAEVDARKLYLDRGCSSLFVFCTERLHMSEGQAYRRIQAARAGRRFPQVLDMVADGRLHLTAISLLTPRLTADNHRELLDAAVHKSKREVATLLAARCPRPDLPDRIRKVPARTPRTPPVATPTPAASEPAPPPAEPAPAGVTSPAATGTETMPAASPANPAPGNEAAGNRAAPDLAAAHPAPPSGSATAHSAPPSGSAAAHPAPPEPPRAAQVPFTLTSPPARPRMQPLSEDRYSVQLTVSKAVHDKLLDAQALLRHSVPGGELEQVLDRALDALLDNLRRRRFGKTDRPHRQPKAPREGSRHVPAHVRREVIARDGEQCTFVDPVTGRRCEERGFLQFEHMAPFAKGGGCTAPNVTVLCARHNRRAAEKQFGERFVQQRISEASKGRT